MLGFGKWAEPSSDGGRDKEDATLRSEGGEETGVPIGSILMRSVDVTGNLPGMGREVVYFEESMTTAYTILRPASLTGFLRYVLAVSCVPVPAVPAVPAVPCASTLAVGFDKWGKGGWNDLKDLEVGTEKVGCKIAE